MERGYLKPEDVNGLQMEFGSAEPALQLIRDIAYRQGAGDWLAEGVRAAAQKDRQQLDRFCHAGKGHGVSGL